MYEQIGYRGFGRVSAATSAPAQRPTCAPGYRCNIATPQVPVQKKSPPRTREMPMPGGMPMPAGAVFEQRAGLWRVSELARASLLGLLSAMTWSGNEQGGTAYVVAGQMQGNAKDVVLAARAASKCVLLTRSPAGGVGLALAFSADPAAVAAAAGPAGPMALVFDDPAAIVKAAEQMIAGVGPGPAPVPVSPPGWVVPTLVGAGIVAVGGLAALMASRGRSRTATARPNMKEGAGLAAEIAFARAYADGAADDAERRVREYARHYGVPARATTIALARDAEEAVEFSRRRPG